MGLFGKIKNILFEDDDEEEVMPVYTKEDVKDSDSKKDDTKIEEVVEKPIETSDNSHFKNVKRDIDFSYDDEDVIGDVASNTKQEEEIELPKRETKKSVFQNFDEEEFERLNSRIERNENKVRKDERKNIAIDDARRANGNFSSTTTSRDSNGERNDNPVKKPFKPSPVISPVYGILDKNYTKDDIIDKKGGIKREKVSKPIISHHATEEELEAKKEVESKDTTVVNIDSVRKKAYGSLENLEKKAALEVKKTQSSEEDEKTKEEVKEEKKVESIPVLPSVDESINEASIEDQIENEEPMNVEKILEEEQVENSEVEEAEEKKPRKMDDLEKTSTLQILDDIEKELNSIKPISKKYDEEADEDNEEKKLERGDTLETDLFNLIDSMYEEGEEEEND